MAFNVKYVADESNGVCVVILEDTEWDAIDYMQKYIGDSVDIYPRKNFKIPHKFVGIAKCHPDDIFDWQVGTDLAFDRAYLAYKKSIKNMLKKISEYLRKRADMIDWNIENNKRFKDV